MAELFYVFNHTLITAVMTTNAEDKKLVCFKTMCHSLLIALICPVKYSHHPPSSQTHSFMRRW